MRACHHGEQAGKCMHSLDRPPRLANCRYCRVAQSGHKQPIAPGSHGEEAPVSGTGDMVRVGIREEKVNVSVR